jgi:hypothetical protein
MTWVHSRGSERNVVWISTSSRTLSYLLPCDPVIDIRRNKKCGTSTYDYCSKDLWIDHRHNDMNEYGSSYRKDAFFTSRENESRLLRANGRKAGTVDTVDRYIRGRLRAADGATWTINLPAVGAKRGVG